MTLTQARGLDPTTFKLGDDKAATFTYVTEPIRTTWEAAMRALTMASDGTSGKRGVVVVGEANAGKTRLALEVIKQALPDWAVLRWSEAFTAADLPEPSALPSGRLVLFLDDMPNYAHLSTAWPARANNDTRAESSSYPAQVAGINHGTATDNRGYLPSGK